MAYSIQAIDTTNQYTLLSSLKAILDGLSVDYFDNTILNVNKQVSPVVNELEFKKGDRTIFKLSVPSLPETTSANKFILYPLGTSKDGFITLGTNIHVITTDNSVSIIMGTRGFIFTKTQTQKNALICYNLGPVNSSYSMTYEDTLVSTYLNYENKIGVLTQILPVLLGSPEGEYLPHVYFAVRTQSAESNSFKQIALNNKNFLTNGNLCLEI